VLNLVHSASPHICLPAITALAHSFLGLPNDDPALASQATQQASDLDAARYLLLAGQHQPAAQRLLAAARKLVLDPAAANPSWPLLMPPSQAGGAVQEPELVASAAAGIDGRHHGIPAVHITPELHLLAYALNTLSAPGLEPDTWAEVFSYICYLGCLSALRYGYLTVAVFLTGTCAASVHRKPNLTGACSHCQQA
jgi:hypothetical protein